MSETNDFNVQPPYSDTGVMRTTESDLRALVDWVSITFKKFTTLSEICGVLNIPESNFSVNEKGYNGYVYSANFGNIKVAWGTPEKYNGNMGAFLDLNGTACREYEQYFNRELDWSTFFALCLNFEVNFTRLDLAIDDFKGYFTIIKAYNKAKKGHIKTPFQIGKRIHEFNLKDGTDRSNTLYLGNNEKMFRFYDKYRERINKGYDIPADVECWNRYEIQLRRESASSAAFLIAQNERELGMFIKGLFKKYTDFKIPSKTDSNKRRWESCKWWTNFLDDCEAIGLTQVAPDVSIPRKKMWIDNQVLPTMAMLNYAFDDDDLFLEYIKSAGEEVLTDEMKMFADDFKKDVFKSYLIKKEMREVITKNKMNVNNKVVKFINEDKKRTVWQGQSKIEDYEELNLYI